MTAGDPATEPVDETNLGWRWLAAIVAVGAGVRLAAARGELWLDEIWSLRLAEQAGSAWRVFTSLHLDNNHHLNTLWLRAWSESSPPLLLRLAAVATGTVSVALLAAGSRRAARADRFAVAALAVACPLLVQYDSEARGYALAAAFSVAAYFAVERWVELGSWRWSFAAGISTGLALLSHLTALFAFAGAIAWMAIDAWQRRQWRASSAGALLPPLVALAVLWTIDLRHLEFGGGPPTQLVTVGRELGRATFATDAGLGEWLALPMLVLAVIGAYRLHRQNASRSAYFLGALILAPPAVVAWLRPYYLAPRYFVVVIPFLLMLIASGLAELAQRNRSGRGLAALILAVYLAAAAGLDLRLIRFGRGSYQPAMDFLAAATPGPTVQLGTDHDFRNGMLLDHGMRLHPTGKRFELVDTSLWRTAPPPWFLLHDFSDHPRPKPHFALAGGARYEWLRTFPYAGLSGWHWHVYRRMAAPNSAPAAATPSGNPAAAPARN